MLSLLKLGILFLAFIAALAGVLVLSVSHSVLEDARHRQVIQHQMKGSHDLNNWRLK